MNYSAAAIDSELRNKLKYSINQHSVLEGKDFELTSGKTMKRYFDMKSTTMDPVGGSLICNSILQAIDISKYDYVAGVVMGGVPMVARLTEIIFPKHNITGLIVRQEPKKHGTGKLIEGLKDLSKLSGANILVVEDTTTTGGSIVSSVNALRDLGAKVEDAFTVVRRLSVASDNLQKIGVSLHYVLTESEFDNE